MSCIKCGYLYCICERPSRTEGMKLSSVEQTLLEMWETWIDGRNANDERVDDDGNEIPDRAPAIALEFFRNDRRVPWLLLELMAKFAKEYGYELG